MSKEEIIEWNKAIAEFDGCWAKYPSMDNTNKYSEWLYPHTHINSKVKDDRLCDMKYHTSWDWLMPVVEKIEQTTSKIIRVEGYVCEITSAANEDPRNMPFRIHRHSKTKIEAVWLAVIDFIHYYNSLKQTHK